MEIGDSGDFRVVCGDQHIDEAAALSRAASMVHAISGLPLSGMTFFRGSRLLPPRAGTMARRRVSGAMGGHRRRSREALADLHQGELEAVIQ
jgi:hypothetical protein